MKKIITILMASLMMLLPSLSNAHHFDPEVAIRNHLHNQKYTTHDISGMNISSWGVHSGKTIERIRARYVLGQWHGIPNVTNRASMDTTLRLTVEFTDGSVQYNNINLLSHVQMQNNHPTIVTSAYTFINSTTGERYRFNFILVNNTNLNYHPGQLQLKFPDGPSITHRIQLYKIP